MKKDIKSFTLTQLTDELTAMGEKAFRAKQMYEWMHVKLVRSFDEMTNLSKEIRERCKENYSFTTLTPLFPLAIVSIPAKRHNFVSGLPVY